MLLTFTALSILALLLLTDKNIKRQPRPLGSIVCRNQEVCLIDNSSPQL